MGVSPPSAPILVAASMYVQLCVPGTPSWRTPDVRGQTRLQNPLHHLQTTCLQIRSHHQVPGVRASPPVSGHSSPRHPSPLHRNTQDVLPVTRRPLRPGSPVHRCVYTGTRAGTHPSLAGSRVFTAEQGVEGSSLHRLQMRPRVPPASPAGALRQGWGC